MSGLTSQAPMGAICAALEQTGMGPGIRYADIQALNLYWSQVRILYSCFEANVRASDSSVFDHEMPGGQYTNLMVSVVVSCIRCATDIIISSKLRNLAWGLNGQVFPMQPFLSVV
jgi:pyruvate carboxylase